MARLCTGMVAPPSSALTAGLSVEGSTHGRSNSGIQAIQKLSVSSMGDQAYSPLILSPKEIDPKFSSAKYALFDLAVAIVVTLSFLFAGVCTS